MHAERRNEPCMYGGLYTSAVVGVENLTWPPALNYIATRSFIGGSRKTN